MNMSLSFLMTRERLIIFHVTLKRRLVLWAASASKLGRVLAGDCEDNPLRGAWSSWGGERENLNSGTSVLLPVLLPVVSSFHTCRRQRRSSEAAAWTAA